MVDVRELTVKMPGCGCGLAALLPDSSSRETPCLVLLITVSFDSLPTYMDSILLCYMYEIQLMYVLTCHFIFLVTDFVLFDIRG